MIWLRPVLACEESDRHLQWWKDIPSHNLRHETFCRPEQRILAEHQPDSGGVVGFVDERGSSVWGFGPSVATKLPIWLLGE